MLWHEHTEIVHFQILVISFLTWEMLVPVIMSWQKCWQLQLSFLKLVYEMFHYQTILVLFSHLNILYWCTQLVLKDKRILIYSHMTVILSNLPLIQLLVRLFKFCQAESRLSDNTSN